MGKLDHQNAWVHFKELNVVKTRGQFEDPDTFLFIKVYLRCIKIQDLNLSEIKANRSSLHLCESLKVNAFIFCFS